MVGTFHLDWKREIVLGASPKDASERELTIEFKDLHLDAGGFTRDFLKPIVREVKRITGPFMPVIDTVRVLCR